MLAQGVPLRVVMEVLGHSSIGVTANTYSHVMPSLVQDAAEKVAGVLFGGR
jgi:integrase